MATTSLHVNKLAAAKRQLMAAIRMFFMPDDELAVHTVAAAAYALLKDIKRDRGLNEAADAFLTSVFYVVRDYRRGTLPDHMTRDAALMAEVERIADKLSLITADSKFSDVRVSIAPALERQYWNDTNRAANFLKHADRDTNGTLPLDELENELLLTKCWARIKTLHQTISATRARSFRHSSQQVTRHTESERLHLIPSYFR